MTSTALNDAERVAQRIALMLHQAENAATSGEAEMYSTRAEELLLKYELDRASVFQTLADAQTALQTEKIVKRELNFTGIYAAALTSMTCTIVEALGSVRVIEVMPSTKTKKRLWFIGFEADVRGAALLATSLVIQCQLALERWWKDVHAAALTPMQKFKERREFICAFGDGATLRIERARLAKLVTAGPSTALVLRDRRGAVNEFMSQFDLETNRVGGWLVGSGDATSAGHAAGLVSNTHDTGVNGGRRAIEGVR